MDAINDELSQQDKDLFIEIMAIKSRIKTEVVAMNQLLSRVSDKGKELYHKHLFPDHSGAQKYNFNYGFPEFLPTLNFVEMPVYGTDIDWFHYSPKHDTFVFIESKWRYKGDNDQQIKVINEICNRINIAGSQYLFIISEKKYSAFDFMKPKIIRLHQQAIKKVHTNIENIPELEIVADIAKLLR